MGLPVIAVIGRPNVGKSTLFNRVTRSRAAVVHEESGVTRDRHVHRGDWNGVPFLFVDTGGMMPVEDGTPFESEITEIAREAIRQADALIFVCDSRSGITSLDEGIARELRGLDKPLHLAVNKVERASDLSDSAAFFRLGLGDPHPISALHGEGVGDLLDAVVADLPERTPDEKVDLRIALIGRPNVGKSSLLNAILGEDRTLVSNVPGTTRDAIDTPLNWQKRKLLLVDTAGVRRRVKHNKGVEYFSVLRSLQAIERCDVALFLLDASTGIVAQDARVAGEIHDAGKACIVAWNKWDLIDKDDRTYLEYEQKVRDDLAFLSYAPVTTISALENQRVPRILEQAWDVGQAAQKTVETSRLNDILGKAVAKNPPKVHNKGTGKVYYATQVGKKPPTFALFVNRPHFFARHYVRYLNNQIRAAVDFPGSRIRLQLRERK